MAAGELTITCPACSNRASVPIAAVKRNNYYCSRCLQKIPMEGIRATSDNDTNRYQSARPKKSSRTGRR